MKPKINKENLRKMFDKNTQPTRLGAMLVSTTIKVFSDDYLRGVMNVDISGDSFGQVNVKLPVLSYLVRLLCEVATDKAVECSLIIDDNLTIRTTYPRIDDLDMTAHVIKVARLAGFRATRDGDILIFKTKIYPRVVLPIFATSSDDFMDMLIFTFNL